MDYCQLDDFKENILIYFLGATNMILYSPLWETMKERNISQYSLIKDFGFSSGQLDRLRKNENVNSYTLNRLCEILDCKIEDIAVYVKE